jgi:glycerol-3-phosphate dehydrogenase
MPICAAVAAVLAGEVAPAAAVGALLARPPAREV